MRLSFVLRFRAHCAEDDVLSKAVGGIFRPKLQIKFGHGAGLLIRLPTKSAQRF